MANRLSKILNVTEKELDKYGVFNAFVDIDSKLYIDPSLLNGLKIKEFRGSHELFESYFNNILTLLSSSSKKNDRF